MIREYIVRPSTFRFEDSHPWVVVNNLCDTIMRELRLLGEDYTISNGVAVHKTAVIAHNVTI